MCEQVGYDYIYTRHHYLLYCSAMCRYPNHLNDRADLDRSGPHLQ